MDEFTVGQEDEATPDPDGVPWETEPHAKEDEEETDAIAVPDFDPLDWVDPGEAPMQHGLGEHGVPNHGDGECAVVPVSLSEGEHDAVLEHSTRLRSLKHAEQIFKELGGAVGASLQDTVQRVMHGESKRFAQGKREDKTVCLEIRAGLDAEDARYRRERHELREHMQEKKKRLKWDVN